LLSKTLPLRQEEGYKCVKTILKLQKLSAKERNSFRVNKSS
jgi:hypothetical protein